MLLPPGNRLPFPCKSLISRSEQTGSVYKNIVEKQSAHADCKSVYTGSIPVIASNIFNQLEDICCELPRIFGDFDGATSLLALIDAFSKIGVTSQTQWFGHGFSQSKSIGWPTTTIGNSAPHSLLSHPNPP